MSDQINELIKEIAIKHHITVGRDDPVLILHTINARLMENNIKAHQDILNNYQNTMAQVTSHWEEEAKRKAEHILNTSLVASKEAMHRQLQESAASTSILVNKEIDRSLAKIYPLTKKVAVFNVIAASFTLLATIVLCFVYFIK